MATHTALTNIGRTLGEGSDQGEDSSPRLPNAAERAARWIQKYLNTRYFNFPDGGRIPPVLSVSPRT